MSTSNGRSDTQREKKQADFLEAFAELLTVTKAIERVKIARSTIYKWRKEDRSFADAWDDVDEAITEEIEREAYRRAIEGVEKPVFQGGKHVGDVKQYSDRLLEMLLKARRPEKYRERLSIDDDREETRRRRELERASEEELDRKLTGIDDNVIPIEKGKAA